MESSSIMNCLMSWKEDREWSSLRWQIFFFKLVMFDTGYVAVFMANEIITQAFLLTTYFLIPRQLWFYPSERSACGSILMWTIIQAKSLAIIAYTLIILSEVVVNYIQINLLWLFVNIFTILRFRLKKNNKTYSPVTAYSNCERYCHDYGASWYFL